MTTYYGSQLGLALSVLDAKLETPIEKTTPKVGAALTVDPAGDKKEK